MTPCAEKRVQLHAQRFRSAARSVAPREQQVIYASEHIAGRTWKAFVQNSWTQHAANQHGFISSSRRHVYQKAHTLSFVLSLNRSRLLLEGREPRRGSPRSSFFF